MGKAKQHTDLLFIYCLVNSAIIVVNFKIFRSPRAAAWAVLGLSWASFGLSWVVLGLSWLLLGFGTFSGRPEAILVRFYGVFGVHLGTPN